MQPAPFPPDEQARLGELRRWHILDTPPEQSYDDAARLAARVCRTPMAIVNLLDERRQWFKARVGIAARSTPREYAFCGYTILDPTRPFIVRDAKRDPRFHDNPLVVGDPHIRFYAGVPLVSSTGHAVGTLSVLDHVPRDIERDELDALHGIARQVVDMLELRRVGAELLEAKRELENILQTVPDVVYVLDAEGRILRWNQQGERVTGFASSELEGKSALRLFPPEEQERVVDAIERALRDGFAELEAHLLRKDGTLVPFWFSARALRDVEENVVGLTGVGRDMTLHRKAEEAVRAQRDQLEKLTKELRAANAELESFAYTVSHDLRAPLRGIQLMSEALVEDHAPQLDDEGRSMLRRVQTEASRMSKLVEDILRLSRASHEIVRRDTVDLSALADDVVRELRAREPREDVDMRIQGGIRVEGDAQLLRIVLDNLLGNAWKYTAGTSATRIALDARTTEREVVCTVRDNGPGFDPARARRMFEPFQRFHGDAFQGTGIGLATVKRIVARHGGRVWAESEPGRGASFSFALPAARAPAPEPLPNHIAGSHAG